MDRTFTRKPTENSIGITLREKQRIGEVEVFVLQRSSLHLPLRRLP